MTAPQPLFFEVPYGVAGPPNPFGVGLDHTGSLQLAPDEPVLWQGRGVMQHSFQPWPNAPEEDLYAPPGDVDMVVTHRHLAYVCNDFVEVRAATAGQWGATSDSITGIMSGLAVRKAAQARRNSQAKKASAGRGMAGQIPLECIDAVLMSPLSEPGDGFFAQIMLALPQGDANNFLYFMTMGTLQMQFDWARWFVSTVATRHLHMIGAGWRDDLAQANPDAHQQLTQMSQHPEGQYLDGGDVLWELPLVMNIDFL